MSYEKSFYTDDITIFNAEKMNNAEDKLDELYKMVKSNRLDILLNYINGLDPLTAVQYLNKLYLMVQETVKDYQTSILTIEDSYISLSNMLVAMYGKSSGISIYGQNRINLSQQVYYFDSSFVDDNSYSLENNGIRIKTSKSYDANSYNNIYIGDLLLTELVNPNTKYTISFFICDYNGNVNDASLKFILSNRSMKDNYGESEEFKINNGWNYVHLETKDFDINSDISKKYLKLELPTNVDIDILLSNVTLEQGIYNNDTPIFIPNSYELPKSFTITTSGGNKINLNDFKGFGVNVEDNILYVNKIDEYDGSIIELSKYIPIFSNLSYEFNSDIEILSSNQKGNIEIYIIDKYIEDNVICTFKINNANGNYNINKKFDSFIRYKEINIKIVCEYNATCTIKFSNFFLKEENSSNDLNHYEESTLIDLSINLYSNYNIKDVIIYKDKKTKLIKKLDKVYLKNLNWNIIDYEGYRNSNTLLLSCPNPNKDIDIKSNSSLLCDRFRVVDDIRDKSNITTGLSINDGQLFLRIYRNQVEYYTVEEFKKWLSKYNPYIIFELNTIIEKEIDNLPNITTYDLNTDIYTEENIISPLVEVSLPISQSETINNIIKILKIVENKLSELSKDVSMVYDNNLNRLSKLDEIIYNLRNNK